MGVGGSRQVVVPCLQNVGARAVGVKDLQGTLVHINLDGLAFAGLQDIRLGKADQLHRRFFNAVGAVILGIWVLQIRLHDLLARGLAGVRDGNVQRKAVRRFGHLVIRPAEVRIAQAVAEGVHHLCIVVKITRVALCQNGILVAGLIVAVTDIDTLGVDNILVAGKHIAVCDGVVAQICSGRGRGCVSRPGVHQVAAGVDCAVQCFADGIGTLLPQCAHPKHSVNVVSAELRHIDGVGHVQQQNHLVKAFGCHLNQVALLLCEGEVLCRQIHALTAAAANHHDCSIIVLRHAVKFSLRVGALRGLVGCKAALPGNAGHFLFIGGTYAGGVEVPQHRVDGKACGLHRLPQVGRSGGVHAARACAAIDKVGCAFAQKGHACALGQRQGISIIAQKNHTLLLNFAAELGRGLLHRRGGGIVTGEILRIAAAAFGGGRHCYGHTDHSRIVVGQRNGNQAGSPQQRKDKRQQNRQYPPHNAEERFHTFFSFFFGLTEFCFFIIAFFSVKKHKKYINCRFCFTICRFRRSMSIFIGHFASFPSCLFVQSAPSKKLRSYLRSFFTVHSLAAAVPAG